jgi:hypothetical protein
MVLTSAAESPDGAFGVAAPTFSSKPATARSCAASRLCTEDEGNTAEAEAAAAGPAATLEEVAAGADAGVETTGAGVGSTLEVGCRCAARKETCGNRHSTLNVEQSSVLVREENIL